MTDKTVLIPYSSGNHSNWISNKNEALLQVLIPYSSGNHSKIILYRI